MEPLDMRAGSETILARVVKVFGEARPGPLVHHFLGRLLALLMEFGEQGIEFAVAPRRYCEDELQRLIAHLDLANGIQTSTSFTYCRGPEVVIFTNTSRLQTSYALTSIEKPK